MPNRTEIGVAVSVLYAGFLVWLVVRRWADVAKLPLNELGDFAAGAFGPLAILWLVLGYFQQGDELKQNTTALKLQADELAESVRQQEQLVAITREQFEEAKAEARRESNRLNAASRPRFECQIFDTEVAGKDCEVRVNLKNVGAPCSHMRVRSAVDGISATWASPDNGTQERLVRVFQQGVDELDPAKFVVSYLDSAGRIGSQMFEVTTFHDEDTWGYVVTGDDDGRVWEHTIAAVTEGRAT